MHRLSFSDQFALRSRLGRQVKKLERSAAPFVIATAFGNRFCYVQKSRSKRSFCKAGPTPNPRSASQPAPRTGLNGEAQTFLRLMKDDSGAVLAGRLLVRAAPFFYSSTHVSKQQLAPILDAISIHLTEIAKALRLGIYPVPSSNLLRAKTITFIIVARELVPEEMAREIARQLVFCTRFPMPLNGYQRVEVASEYEVVSKQFKGVSERIAN